MRIQRASRRLGRMWTRTMKVTTTTAIRYMRGSTLPYYNTGHFNHASFHMELVGTCVLPALRHCMFYMHSCIT